MLYMERPQGATLYEHSRTCTSQREVSELIYDTHTLYFILIFLQGRGLSPCRVISSTVGQENFSIILSNARALESPEMSCPSRHDQPI